MSLSRQTYRGSCGASSMLRVDLPTPLGPVMMKRGSWRNGCLWPQWGQMAQGPVGSMACSSDQKPHCWQMLNMGCSCPVWLAVKKGDDVWQEDEQADDDGDDGAEEDGPGGYIFGDFGDGAVFG